MPGVLDAHPRADGVGEPQGAGANAIDVVVEDVIPLARHLIDAVDVDWSQQVLFVDGQVIRLAVDLPRAREDDFDVLVVMTARFEDGQL